MKYAIFLDDSEINVYFELESEESIDTIKELIKYELENGLENGYIESYPFFKAHWEIVGGKLPIDFDKSQIIKLEV